MDIKQALVAQKLKRPVILSWPTLGDIEYEYIESIHSRLPEYGIETPVAILKDRFGNSSIVADIKNIRLKEIRSDKTELPKA